MVGKPKNKPGDVFGHLTIVEDTGRRTRRGSVIWKCRCVCGKTIERSQECILKSVRQGCTISCGCKRSKWIGKGLAFDENRINKARNALGQIDGTTIAGISRKRINKNNKSGVRGVCFMTRDQKWKASTQLRGVELGRRLFDNKEDAIAWRKELEDTYFEPIKERYRRENNEHDV